MHLLFCVLFSNILFILSSFIYILPYVLSSVAINCPYKFIRVDSGNLTHKAEWKSHVKLFIISKRLKNEWPLWNKNTKMERKISKKHKATERDENSASLALKRMEMKDKTITEMKSH